MESMESGLVPLSLTFVEYAQGDHLGKLLAVVSLTPLVFSVAHLSYFLLAEEAFNLHVLVFGAGVIVDHGFNHVLKNVYQELRPLRASDFAGHLYQEFGWPSSHCQFCGFYATYLILYTYLGAKWPCIKRVFVTLGLSITSALVTFGRVYLQYHTWDQCLSGLAVGAFTGLVWYGFVHLILVPYVFPWVARLWIVRLVGLQSWPSKTRTSERTKKRQ